MPPEMTDAYLLAVTGWPPSELDSCDCKRLEYYLIYREVTQIASQGGDLKL